jgi:hypothetical protein
VTRIYEVAARAPCPWPLCGCLLPLVVGDELPLLVRVRFPQKAGHLVVAGAHAPEQVLDATGRVPDSERLLDPQTDLIGVAEPTRADFLLETLGLTGREVARVAPVVQSAEGIEAAVAEQAQPIGDLPHATAEQVGDLTTGPAVGHPEHGREALADALVGRLVAAALEFLPLLSVKLYRLHRSPLRIDFGPVATSGSHSLAAVIVG